jgi:hypothetical protein
VRLTKVDVGRAFGGGREQGRHLGTRGIRILRPAGGLADIGIGDVGVTGHFREHRRLLGAAHDQRRRSPAAAAEAFEFRPAQLARG